MDPTRPFAEAEPGFDYAQAVAEADRCLLCHDPPCSTGCPANTDPGAFIRKLRLRNVKGAIRVIKRNNALGGSCALVCPTCDLCEGRCAAAALDRPIRIGKIQRFLMEHAAREGIRVFDPPSRRPERVAVIGAGPAGLSCASELAHRGFGVAVFERRPEPGGVLRYGIPDFRLRKEVLDRDLADLADLGVEIRCDSPVAGRAAADRLLAEGYCAVFLATGLGESDRLLPAKRSARGLHDAASFLERVRREESFATVRREIAGKIVCVLGGGAVAADCCLTAVRLGAAEVYLAYRRSYAQMPMTRDEKLAVLEAGVHLFPLHQPKGYEIDRTRGVRGVRFVRTRLGPPDASGRRSPVPVRGSAWTLPVDVAIEAIGMKAEAGAAKVARGLKVSGKNLVVVNGETLETAASRVYAGGDIVRGPSLVSFAVRDGRVAAAVIAERIAGEGKGARHGR